ncbi:MAG: hypothetical protein IJ190_03980 [Prevotella sp.]|nr:hypothetical protein [Prevotella sp.]
MTTTQLRAELFREMNPLLDSEKAMKEILTFVRSLIPAKKEDEKTAPKSYKVMPLSPEIKKWNGCVSLTEKEIESDPRLKAILSK